jgi:hypothetical protein
MMAAADFAANIYGMHSPEIVRFDPLESSFCALVNCCGD